ncbi:DUF3149 domain-containing protein [Aliikangiella maris]|uniref:DUF3149 domain-containing protein n=2 Tax=Aliikangiella maris TaxID=3162458 RepID=A0ABV2BTU7_9GAMM
MGVLKELFTSPEGLMSLFVISFMVCMFILLAYLAIKKMNQKPPTQ